MPVMAWMIRIIAGLPPRGPSAPKPEIPANARALEIFRAEHHCRCPFVERAGLEILVRTSAPASSFISTARPPSEARSSPIDRLLRLMPTK